MLVALTASFAALGLLLPATAAGADPIPLPTGFPTRPPLPVPLPCPPTCAPLQVPDPYDAVVYGDSYTSGEGASHDHKYVPKADGSEDFTHKSGLAPFYVAWAALEMGRNPLRRLTLASDTMQTLIGRDQLYFHASSGAWIKHLDEPQMEKKGGTVVRNPPQAQDVPTMAKIAYFGLGGNDAGFADLVSTAAEAYLNPPNGRFGVFTWKTDQEQSVALEVSRLQPRVAELKNKVAHGLWSVRETHPVAEIVVALYPLGVKESGNTDLEEITGRSMDLMYPFAAKVNQAIRDGVAQFQADYPQTKVHIFDPNTAGPNGTSVVAGHELGQPDSYFQGLVRRPDVLWSGKIFQSFQESFHPNELGAVAIGKALATFLAARMPALFPNGPNFGHLTIDPRPLVTTPDEIQSVGQWAATNSSQVCEETDIDSVCRAITPSGIVLSKDLWFDPGRVWPFPGPPAPGGPDTGSPGGGGGGGGGSTWIPADYIPRDPCDIFRPVRFEFFAGVQIQGGPLRTPTAIDGLIFAPKKPKCVPGVGLIFE
ncbi:hypothetical protein [Sphaerisporangium dianthi]|uniref:SGNH hydrolase-type esterase domain-containing protein n=1 Tax=Sphaerisporangium dianthi TaxID=1436120 RepID=A0ABV9CL51_9ACTN